MKFTFKSEILPILIILISVVLGFYFYSVFPDRVPIHWNYQGQVDNWGSKFTGAFLMPFIGLGMYLLFLFIPLIDPKKEKYQQFAKVYFIFRLAILLIMFGVYLVASANALGYNVRVEVWIPAIIGFFFMILGNYMGKIKPNWFMGIRTPWTLSNDEVWAKTHRLGGKLFIIFGLFLILTPLMPSSSFLWTLLIPVIFISVIPIVYSYIIYKKIKRNEEIK